MPYYCDLVPAQKIIVMRREFHTLVSSLFSNPTAIIEFVKSQKITNDQAKNIIKYFDELNVNDCVCCRKFDSKKLLFRPVNSILEPLIEVARESMRKKYL